jgi:hypothetical protein
VLAAYGGGMTPQVMPALSLFTLSNSARLLPLAATRKPTARAFVAGNPKLGILIRMNQRNPLHRSAVDARQTWLAVAGITRFQSTIWRVVAQRMPIA